MDQYKTVLKGDSAFSPRAALNVGSIHLERGQVEQAVTCFRAALEMDGSLIEAHCNLGTSLVVIGEVEEGMAYLRQAVRISPDFVLAVRHLAWFLATHPSAEVRDPNEAIRLAERAMAMTQGRDAGVLDTLAAAYALDGQYKKAVETAQKAFAIASRMRNYELADQIQERLRLYQFECPYYEDPKVQLERLVAKAKKAQNREPRTEDGELDSRVRENDNLEVSDEAETIGAE